ncbi:MAG: hypothetical protein K0V04_34155 [Deltaproteobacteria bacterium]|nr:hypothetical protein [Deltaproteobacteria bacterium]
MPMPVVIAAFLLAPSEPLPGAPREQPPAVSAIAFGFAFEPQVGSLAALDDQLRAYGFAPVGSVFLPTWGLRGRMRLRSGLYVGMSMSYGLRNNRDAISPVPTTTTFVDTAIGAGYWAPFGLLAGLDVGFASVVHSVGSEQEGGALVYLGPSLHPRVGWAYVGQGPSVVITAGYLVHIPVGSPHSQPLWEASFERPAIHSFTVGLESGFGWRPGRRR